MGCTVLRKFYGRDTRAVLVSAVIINLVLWVSVVFNSLGWLDFSLPQSLETTPTSFVIVATVAVISGVLAPATRQRSKQMCKSFTFLASALIQAIFANGYVTDFPPLSLMLLVSTALGVWFFGAAVYVLKCEGLDGDYAGHS